MQDAHCNKHTYVYTKAIVSVSFLMCRCWELGFAQQVHFFSLNMTSMKMHTLYLPNIYTSRHLKALKIRLQSLYKWQPFYSHILYCQNGQIMASVLISMPVLRVLFVMRPHFCSNWTPCCVVLSCTSNHVPEMKAMSHLLNLPHINAANQTQIVSFTCV